MAKPATPWWTVTRREANAEKVAAYCKENPDATLASAMEALAKM